MTVDFTKKRPVVIGSWIRFQGTPDSEGDPILPMFLPVSRINGARPERANGDRTIVGIVDEARFDGICVEHPYADVEAAIALASAKDLDPDAGMPKAEEVGHR